MAVSAARRLRVAESLSPSVEIVKGTMDIVASIRWTTVVMRYSAVS